MKKGGPNVHGVAIRCLCGKTYCQIPDGQLCICPDCGHKWDLKGPHRESWLKDLNCTCGHAKCPAKGTACPIMISNSQPK